MMPDKNANNSRETMAANRRGAVRPACTAEHRKTPSDGLRILARIIARAHLQRPQMESALGKRPMARHQNQRAEGG